MFGSVVAALVGNRRCMVAGELHVPSVHELKALEKTILGHGCEEPSEVLVVQLVGFAVLGCLLDECGELAQLARGGRLACIRLRAGRKGFARVL